MHGDSVTRRLRALDYESLVVGRAVTQWGLASPNGEAVSERSYRARRAQLAFDHGYNLARGGSHAEAARSFLAGLKHRPLWPACWLQLARTVPGLRRRRD
jgi:hypothetical protein